MYICTTTYESPYIGRGNTLDTAFKDFKSKWSILHNDKECPFMPMSVYYFKEIKVYEELVSTILEKTC